MTDRHTIQESTSLTLHIDGKAHRLTIRFACVCLQTLSQRRGLMGHVHYMENKNADSVANAVTCIKDIIRNFSTYGHLRVAMQGEARRRKPRFDRELFDHIRNHVDIYNTDAEQVMLLASEVLREPKDTAEPFLPACNIILKDPTHAARRAPPPQSRDALSPFRRCRCTWRVNTTRPRAQVHDAVVLAVKDCRRR